MPRRRRKHHALLTSVVRPPGTEHRTPTPHIHSLNENPGIMFSRLLQNSVNQKLKWIFCPSCSVGQKIVIHRPVTPIRMWGPLRLPHGDFKERDINVLASIVGSTSSYAFSWSNELNLLQGEELQLIVTHPVKNPNLFWSPLPPKN